MDSALAAVSRVPRHGGRQGSVKIFSRFDLGWRRRALAQAVTAPLICWSFSSSMFKYLLVDQAVPAMCRRRAAARLKADWPSGKAPTIRTRRLISRRKLSDDQSGREPVQQFEGVARRLR